MHSFDCARAFVAKLFEGEPRAGAKNIVVAADCDRSIYVCMCIYSHLAEWCWLDCPVCLSTFEASRHVRPLMTPRIAAAAPPWYFMLPILNASFFQGTSLRVIFGCNVISFKFIVNGNLCYALNGCGNDMLLTWLGGGACGNVAMWPMWHVLLICHVRRLNANASAHSVFDSDSHLAGSLNLISSTDDAPQKNCSTAIPSECGLSLDFVSKRFRVLTSWLAP